MFLRDMVLWEENISVARLRKSEIEFLWVQLEELIEDGKNKDAKTKLGLMQRVYQLLAKTIPTNKTAKKRWVGLNLEVPSGFRFFLRLISSYDFAVSIITQDAMLIAFHHSVECGGRFFLTIELSERIRREGQ
jgi:hypothetical protein